jgi:polyphosphate glucokinase
VAKHRLGIDIGGTGIKAGLVDLEQGLLVGERKRVRTPTDPEAMVEAVRGLATDFGYEGPVGIGFPAVVIDGRVMSANNIQPDWVGVDARTLFHESLGLPVEMVNDADAAALCEGRYGAARDAAGSVMVVTFGTGIGSGLLHDGVLVPNVELGNLELDGHVPSESYFCGNARDDEGLTWPEWGSRANRFLRHVQTIFSPVLFVVGGGVVRKWDEWRHQLDPGLAVVPASRANDAGVIGAATLVA